jgi:hypothetical protein
VRLVGECTEGQSSSPNVGAVYNPSAHSCTGKIVHGLLRVAENTEGSVWRALPAAACSGCSMVTTVECGVGYL